MTKLEIEAIRKLPEEYVVDELFIHPISLPDDSLGIIAITRTCKAPLLFENGKWRELNAREQVISPPAIQ